MTCADLAALAIFLTVAAAIGDGLGDDLLVQEDVADTGDRDRASLGPGHEDRRHSLRIGHVGDGIGDVESCRGWGGVGIELALVGGMVISLRER